VSPDDAPVGVEVYAPVLSVVAVPFPATGMEPGFCRANVTGCRSWQLGSFDVTVPVKVVVPESKLSIVIVVGTAASNLALPRGRTLGPELL
jgi:hypothetical protein